MHAVASLVSLALLLASAVHASVYVIDPVQSSQCTGGQPCQVQWVDNGQAPLLSDIGECDVALYTGEFQLVQSLPSVDVATTSSFTFTPNADAGPDGQYYIVFSASSISYQGFSGSFSLTGMTGTTVGGGSSAPTSTPATTLSGSSTSAGSSAPGSSIRTSTLIGPSGSSTLTTPSVTTIPTSTVSSKTSTSTSTSTSASATPTSAAGRVGSSTSLGGLAALLVLSGVFAL